MVLNLENQANQIKYILSQADHTWTSLVLKMIFVKL